MQLTPQTQRRAAISGRSGRSRAPCVRVSAATVAASAPAQADTKFADYKPTVAAFFPGQGAQSVGMAKDLVAEVPAAKAMFDKASEILGYDLLQVRHIIRVSITLTHIISVSPW